MEEYEEYPVMPGVSCQSLRKHDGNSVTCTPMAIDRRDYSPNNPISLPHELTCSNLVHYTEIENAVSICHGDGNKCIFKAKQCRITDNVSFNVSWWSPLPPENWENVIRNNLPHAWDECEDIGNSSVFRGASLCGPIGIIVEYDDILHEYANSRRSNVSNVELRILGTFLYKSEIMYAILVCIRGDAGVQSYPLINEAGTEAFQPKGHYFIWKVYSTVGFGDSRPLGVRWTWDHIAFAFNCPTSKLYIEPTMCEIIKKKCTIFKPLSRSEHGTFRNPDEMIASEELINWLDNVLR